VTSCQPGKVSKTVTDMWHIGARLWWWKWGSWSRQKDT